MTVALPTDLAASIEAAASESLQRLHTQLTTKEDVDSLMSLMTDAVRRGASDWLSGWNSRQTGRTINKLPSELLALCVAELDQRSRHRVLGVCRAWRQTLVAVPTLWKTISLVLPRLWHDESAADIIKERSYARMMVYRSGVIPLSVKVTGSNIESTHLTNGWVLDHSESRIEQLHIDNAVVHESLAQLLINLRVIEGKGTFRYLQPVLFERLERVALETFTLCGSLKGNEPFFPVLHTFRATCTSMSGSHNLLPSSPSLTDLVLNVDSLRSMPSGAPASTLERFIIQRSDRISRTDQLGMARLFSQWNAASLPRLRTVFIMDSNALSHAMRLFRQLHQREDWSLRVECDLATFFDENAEERDTVTVTVGFNQDLAHLGCFSERHIRLWPVVSAASHVYLDISDLWNFMDDLEPRPPPGRPRETQVFWQSLEIIIGPTYSVHVDKVLTDWSWPSGWSVKSLRQLTVRKSDIPFNLKLLMENEASANSSDDDSTSSHAANSDADLAELSKSSAPEATQLLKLLAKDLIPWLVNSFCSGPLDQLIFVNFSRRELKILDPQSLHTIAKKIIIQNDERDESFSPEPLGSHGGRGRFVPRLEIWEQELILR